MGMGEAGLDQQPLVCETSTLRCGELVSPPKLPATEVTCPNCGDAVEAGLERHPGHRRERVAAVPRPPSTSACEVDAAAGHAGGETVTSSVTSALSHPQMGTLLFMPLAYPSSLDRRTQLRGCGSDVRRGGALEPGARAISVNAQAKAATYSAANSAAPKAQKGLSLVGGASSRSVRISSWASLLSCVRFGVGYKKGDPFGSPSLKRSYG